MKDNLFDKQFNDGLRNLERRPRPEAWLAIEQRLPSYKARPVVWPWYAAAASIAILTVGAYLYNQSGPATQNTLAKNDAKIVPVRPIKKIALPSQSVAQFAEVDQSTKTVEADKTIKNIDNQHIKNIIPVNILPEIHQDVAVVLPEIRQESLPPVLIDPIIKDVVAQNTARTKEASTEKVIVINVKEIQEEAVVQNMVSIEKEANKKQFKLGKFLKQLNNARKGDEVNWEEAGLNSNNILAKADERIEQSREKVTETYQNVKSRLSLK
jgi:hypothetical protein